MAKQQSTSSTEVNATSKGMQKDLFPTYSPKEQWSHARNAANNSVDGDIGVIGNEPANLLCAIIPYTVIGTIHTYGDQWVIYSTDDIDSEIGIFDDNKCEYTTLVNDRCLSFNRKYLITGAAKENYDCTWQVYWDDGNNPSRTLNIDDIPYIQEVVSAPGADCVLYEDTTVLDCEKIRLAPLLDTPCVKLNKNVDGGQLRNGSYQAYIAYVVNTQRVTDYIGVSNIQALFAHKTNAGSLDIEITNLDKEFEEYELVILADNQGQKVATRIGVYSTEQTVISLDFISNSETTDVTLRDLFLRRPAYEKSDSMYVVNDYLIRQGPTEQFDFNYQPIANNIQTNWVVAEYDAEYYYKGGNKTQFMRDEVYSFFIRWIYNTGEKSLSYHIPGRAPAFNGSNQFNQPLAEEGPASGINVISESGQEFNFQTFNTASITAGNLSEPTEDGGTVIARGQMAYWQSTERYPATDPVRWGDLCGKEIRHHKFPTEETAPALQLSADTGATIRILGVEFSNIERPKFNDGTYIPNVVGYEILRGSRQGNKSILAKGIFRNMREYDIPDNEGVFGPKIGLYPNFPYNDLRRDVYHHEGLPNQLPDFIPGGWTFQVDPVPRTEGCDNWNASISNFPPLPKYRRDVFTFHSPELMFKRPFLNPYEMRIYGAYSGESVGSFKASEEHPQNKLLRNFAAVIAGIIGIGYAIGQMQGTQRVEKTDATNANTPWLPIWLLAGLGSSGTNAPGVNIAATASQAAVGSGTIGINTALNALLEEAGKFADLLGTGGATSDAINVIIGGVQQGLGLLPGMTGGGYRREYIKDKDSSLLPVTIKLITGVLNSRTNIAIGAQKIIDLMYNLVAPEDFAFKFNSYGLFDSYHKTQSGVRFRSRNVQSNYIGNTFTVFNTDYKVNNLFRPDTVVIQTKDVFANPQVFGAPVDKSRYCIGGDADNDYGDQFINNPNAKQSKPISALYGALKFNYDNQYGQIEGIKQVLMNGCLYQIDLTKPDRFKYETGPIFSGDTYVGRYTEKTIMPIFSDFLYGQPDQYPYNYLQRINIPYPRFWMDTRKYDTTALATELSTLSLANGPGFGDALPNDLFYLDRGNSCGSGLADIFDTKKGNSAFAMRYAYMYTHVNGVLDFFVESEVNLPQRDWEDTRAGRYYDNFRYTDVDELFHAEIIKEDNTYVYDYSLSASRFITNLIPGSVIQPRDYDPEIAETCFSYYPKRLIYSLQAQEEAKKDFWRVFLPNNFRDFKDQVNVIKPINKNGAVIFFPYQSPQMFQGVDQLQTDLGTKITLGDGGLFNQAFQNLVNSEMANEYGSCESQRGIINSPFGFFFISQAQGKIFQQNGQSLNPISNKGMKWWFAKYLPSNLIRQFPEFEFSVLADNPVIGIGCQVIYDITDDIAYFCKRDFTLKEEYEGLVTYDSELDCFVTNGNLPVPEKNIRTQERIPILPPPISENVPGQGEAVDQDQPVTPGSRRCIEIGDPIYFDDCSWTVSYDPKAEAWISFHDWHPELCMSSINHFLTTKTGTTDIPQCPPGFVYNADLEKCVRLIDATEDAVVSVDELAIGVPDRCPEGFTFNEEAGVCEKITEAPADCGDLATVLKSGTNFNYGKFGARFYESTLGRPLPIAATAVGGYKLEDANGTELLYPYTTSGTGGGTGPLVPLWQDRLNTIGAWAENNASGNDEPVLEWIGFTICITVSQTKQYSVGLAADNRCRFGLNGTIVAELEAADNTRNFNYWHVIPITLQAGTNVITLEGYNAGSDAAYGSEIYDATPEELSNITTQGELDQVLIFSTLDVINNGGAFDLGEGDIGCSCPDGFVLSNCTGALQCVQIETAEPLTDCNCPEDYTLVYFNKDEQNFTLPDGDCFDEELPPPLCRKVECLCPPGPDPDAIVTQTGQCDDVYQAGPNGNRLYINPNPRKCTYKLQEEAEPNFKVGGIWRHNYRCDLFANYYDVDYPWEVELIESTGQNVMTLRSVEYQLESYVYKGNQFNACGDDKWHDLDFNFDESIIYNSEQVSGLLRLELSPKEDPINALTYPIINANDIQILYSKEEQKYRFNQFWDTTNDRGEFSNAEQNILITQCNGYIRELNEFNLNYNKSEDQRKKFRHYYNKVLLRRNLSNNRKMLLTLVNSKLNLSFR
jgi:hypothetical protein